MGREMDCIIFIQVEDSPYELLTIRIALKNAFLLLLQNDVLTLQQVSIGNLIA